LVGALELHHIYPKDWCRNNSNEFTKEFVNINKEENNWVDSPANLMPMHSETNKKWMKMEPSMALNELGINSEEQIEMLRQYFIDSKAQKLLEGGSDNMGRFLKQRHQSISMEIRKLMRV